MDCATSKNREELRRTFFAINSPRDVAEALGISYSRLVYHLYKRPPAKRYTTFDIPKKTGGRRQISAPISAIKLLQRKLNRMLQAVYDPKPSAHGFIEGRSIVTNARSHENKRFVLNVDLMDFFPSINFGRVRGMFKVFPCERNNEVATILAQLCCHENALPQGAPTSPVVANLVCRRLDSELQKLASRHRCRYSRYADDLTFSTSAKEFPKALAHYVSGLHTGSVIGAGPELTRIIHSNGFLVNDKKVRLHTRLVRQEVTGLTINEFPNTNRRFIRQIRAMLHAWEKFGEAAAEKEFAEKFDKKPRFPRKYTPQFRHVVRGKIEFLGMVRGKSDDLYIRFAERLKVLIEAAATDAQSNTPLA